MFSIGTMLVGTRIAHWTSDVMVGLALEATFEHVLRFITGFGRQPRAG
jgi:hypothetical protein